MRVGVAVCFVKPAAIPHNDQRFFVVLATFRKVHYLQTQVYRVTVVLLSESLTQACNHCRPDIDSQS